MKKWDFCIMICIIILQVNAGRNQLERNQCELTGLRMQENSVNLNYIYIFKIN